MNFNSELHIRARYNMRALRDAGIPIDRAHQVAEHYATRDIDVISCEYRHSRLFLKLCEDGVDRRPFEAELTLWRGAK